MWRPLRDRDRRFARRRRDRRVSQLQSNDPGYLRLGMCSYRKTKRMSLYVFSGLTIHPAGYPQADLPKADAQSTSGVAVQA